MTGKPVVVQSFVTTTEARMAQSALRVSGIPAELSYANYRGISRRYNWTGLSVDVVVAEEDVAEAKERLGKSRHLEVDAPPGELCCPECGSINVWEKPGPGWISRTMAKLRGFPRPTTMPGVECARCGHEWPGVS